LGGEKGKNKSPFPPKIFKSAITFPQKNWQNQREEREAQGHNMRRTRTNGGGAEAAAAGKRATAHAAADDCSGHAHDSGPKTSHVQVVVRGRPINPRETKSGLSAITQFHGRQVTLAGRGKSKPRTFTFDGAYGPDKDQEAIYEGVVRPIVSEALGGFNCTIFAYGQTGTGKTHTMQGDDFEGEIPEGGFTTDLTKSSGIVQRAVAQIFETLNASGCEYAVRVSFLELYNEEIRDLLVPNGVSSEDLKLFVAPQGGVTVHGLEEVPASNASDVFKVVHQGVGNRMSAETQLNSRSSRSHSIFTIMIHMKETGIDGEDIIRLGKLNLVDLAGSENIKRSGAQSHVNRKREAGNINQSLLTLGRVINALTEGQPHVPYRESKLTRLLQDSLGGSTKTCIIATMSPASDCYEETVSTLEYAQRAKNIKNTPAINEKTTKRALMKEFNQEIEKLRSDLMAARRGDGFYISKDTYEDMAQTKEEQTQQIEELETRIEEVVTEMERTKELFDAESRKLAMTSAELSQTKTTLVQTETKLDVTVGELNVAARTVKESRAIISERERVENELAQTAQELQQHAEIAHADIGSLHDKIDRKAAVEQSNLTRAEKFSNHAVTRVGAIRNDVMAFTKDNVETASRVISSIDDFKAHFDEQMESMTGLLGALSDQAETHMAFVDSSTQAYTRDADELAKTWSADMEKVVDTASSKSADHNRDLEAQVASLRAAMVTLSGAVTRWTENTTEVMAAQASGVSTFMTKHADELDSMARDIDTQEYAQRQAIEDQRAAIATSREKHEQDAQAMQAATLAQVTKMLDQFTTEQQSAMNAVCESATGGLATIQKSAEERAVEQATQLRVLSRDTNTFSSTFQEENESMRNQVCEDIQEVVGAAKKSVGVTANTIDVARGAWTADGSTTMTEVTEFVSVCASTQQDRAQKFATDTSAAVKDMKANGDGTLTETKAAIARSHDLSRDVQVGITGEMVETRRGSESRLDSVASNLSETGADIKQYFDSIKKDVPTGQTPAKKARTYPKELSRTRPHEEIVASMPKTPSRQSAAALSLENKAN
jgi:kinesin family member 11